MRVVEKCSQRVLKFHLPSPPVSLYRFPTPLSQELYRRYGLTLRQSEVAEVVARGLPNKLVALELDVVETTVKFPLTDIYQKMRIKQRAQMVYIVNKIILEGVNKPR